MIRELSHARTLRRQDNLVAAFFIAPLLILTFVVTLIPIGTALKWSLYSTHYTNMEEYVGFQNYINIFTEGSAAVSMLNSLWYVLGSLAVVFPLGIVLAVLLNQHIRLQGIYRTLLIIPWVISQTITAMLFRWMCNNSYGVIVYFISLFTGNRPALLADVTLTRFTVLLANVWNTLPVVIVMTLAALQSIPSDIYEAAQVDGSNGLNTFRRITLPLLKPTLGVTLITQSIEYFSMVTMINTLTDGGPFKATQTLSVYAYREGFVYWDLGESSAISILILLLNVVFSLVYICLLNRNQDA